MKIDYGTQIYPHKVRVGNTFSEMFVWCSEHYEIGTWIEIIGIVGKTSSFCFKSKDDALLFLLRWTGNEK